MKRRHFSSFCEEFDAIIVEVGTIRSIFNQRCYLCPALRRVGAAGGDYDAENIEQFNVQIIGVNLAPRKVSTPRVSNCGRFIGKRLIAAETFSCPLTQL